MSIIQNCIFNADSSPKYVYTSFIRTGNTDNYDLSILQTGSNDIISGDLLIIAAFYDDNRAPIAITPSDSLTQGSETEGGNDVQSTYYRLLNGSEPSTVNFDVADFFSNRWIFTQVAYRDVNFGASIEASNDTAPSLSGFTVGKSISLYILNYSSASLVSTALPTFTSEGYTFLYGNDYHHVYEKIADSTTMAPSISSAELNNDYSVHHIRLEPK